MREQILSSTVEYLLENGLAGLSLRPLAKRLGTSDRMILYYFKTKDALVREAVSRLAQTMISQIKERCLIGGLKSPGDFVQSVWEAFVDTASRPMAMLFLELDLLSLREPKTYGDTGRYLMGEWTKVFQSSLGQFFGNQKIEPSQIDGVSAELLGAILQHLVSQGNSPKGTLKRIRARADAISKG